jgi:NAD(P)-dependent dehydrogenase (short-subunit alcohol dehydrogenase family)
MGIMNRVKDKVVIITGGALGIGRATSLLLAKEGATAVVTDISEVNGNKVVEEIRRSGGKADFWHLDVTDENEVRNVFAAVHTGLGRLDVLVNNAGIAGVNKPTHEITEEEWDKVLGINVKGVFFCTKHAIPHMQRGGGGSIINLSSIYGLVGAPDLPPYHASKGATEQVNASSWTSADRICLQFPGLPFSVTYSGSLGRDVSPRNLFPS